MSNAHLEHITRAAHRVMGAAADYLWDDDSCSLYIGDPLYPEVSFSPLRNGGDAFTLEAVLRLDVTYEADGKYTRIVVRRAGTTGSPRYMALMRSDATPETAMRERMRAVTQFTAILDQLDVAEN